MKRSPYVYPFTLYGTSLLIFLAGLATWIALNAIFH